MDGEDVQRLMRLLEAIAQRARTIEEIIEAGRAATEDAGPEKGAPILDRWCTAMARGDREAFARRLSWDGHDPVELGRILARGEAAPARDLPSWLGMIAGVLMQYRERLTPLIEEGLPPVAEATAGDEPVVFPEVWWPFVEEAARELDKRLAGTARLLAPEALEDLRLLLLRDLSRQGALILYEGFRTIRDHLARSGRDIRPDQRDVVRSFLTSMARGGLLTAFREYSVAARQTGLAMLHWVDMVAEFVDRVAADRAALEETFGGGAPLGLVQRVAALSEPHRGGRRVLAVTFESGRRVIYKPKDMRLEAAYNRFLAWLGEQALESAPPFYDVLLRDGYGWTAFVEPTPIADEAALRTYVRRAGGLVAVAYLLGGADLHLENAVATAAGPMVVDGESFLLPRLEGRHLPWFDGALLEGDGAGDTVLDTGLVFFPEVDPEGRSYDMSALCGRGGHLQVKGYRAFREANSDAMTVASQPVVAKQESNLPVHRGRRVPVTVDVDGLIAGFDEMMSFFESVKEDLAAPDGPLQVFDGLACRVVFRPTAAYSVLFYAHLLSPRFQRLGWAQTVAIETLNRVFRDHEERPAYWPLVASERRALENLDIPAFFVPVDEVAFPAPSGEMVTGLVRESGRDRLRARVAQLGPEQRRQQARLLRFSLGGGFGTAAEAEVPDRAWTELGRAVVRGEVDTDMSDPLLRAAAAVSSGLWSLRRETPEGEPDWPWAETVRQARARHRAAGAFLYSGRAGMALFYAALAKRTGSSIYGRRVLEQWRMIDRASRDIGPDPVDGLLIGAGSGLGGILYAAALTERLTGETMPLDVGLRVAASLTDARIGADDRFDVEGGTAGALLGLVALYRRTGDLRLLERAMVCGEHLLRSARTAPRGAAWTTMDDLMLAGFAHGAAGIALSLLRLYELCRHEPFLEAARQAMEYERSLFNRQHQNWPVLGRDEQGRIRAGAMVAWCHGAPGIALARAGGLALVDDEALREELDVALATTLRAPLTDLDHLCCGTAGRIDAALTAGVLLGRDELRQWAGQSAVALVTRALRRGGFGLESADSATSFFRGLPGIGYEFLRFADPSAIPSVLLFEL